MLTYEDNFFHCENFLTPCTILPFKTGTPMKKLCALLLLTASLFCDTTRHIWNGSVPYQAKTGTIDMHGKKDNVTGRMFYTAYTKENADPETRPITFCFNGGPGSSSIWLHMGAFGPRRLITLKEGATPVAPYRWIENTDSLIDITDLVFIDPIGTGFSRAEKEEDPSQFWSMEADVESISHFIESYLSEHGRWISPKYLAGESYGTSRAAGLASNLQCQHGIYLNGIILISCAIDYLTLDAYSSNNPVGSLLLLPTFTATAWHYQRLPDLSFEDAITRSKAFANGPYASALLLGQTDTLPICEELAYLSGLPLEFVLRHAGRISLIDFSDEFFGKERKVLGVYDTSMIGDKIPGTPWNFLTDPSIAHFEGIYTATFHDYLQKELNHTSSYPHYYTLSFDTHMAWKWPPGQTPNQTGSLQVGMIANPKMRLFVTGGHLDLITPFAAGEFTVSQLTSSVRDRIETKFYHGGHMFYLHPQSLHQFRKDLEKFYQE